MGPCFSGGGGSDLCAFLEPFNDEGHCRSYANKSGYLIPVDGPGTNILTKNKSEFFTITELEVWQVTYLE